MEESAPKYTYFILVEIKLHDGQAVLDLHECQGKRLASRKVAELSADESVIGVRVIRGKEIPVSTQTAVKVSLG